MLVLSVIFQGQAPRASQEAAQAAVRHLIYAHGRIVQETQSPRPRHPQFGHYELDSILEVLRSRGFVVSGSIRPKAASVSESADRLVEQVRGLLASGVKPDRVTVVGASMGASISLLASARLQNDGLRFVFLGACATENMASVRAEEGKAPRGRLLFIRESSDTLGPCTAWTASASGVREIVLDTGLDHGFLYQPLPAWMKPALAWADEGAPASGCLAGAAGTAEARAVAEGIVAADNDRDMPRVLSYYSTDAVLLPPGEEAVMGRDAIRVRYERLFADFSPRIEGRLDEVCASGGRAFIAGHNGGRLVPRGEGAPRDLDDDYLMVLRREADGVWRISHLIWRRSSG